MYVYYLLLFIFLHFLSIFDISSSKLLSLPLKEDSSANYLPSRIPNFVSNFPTNLNLTFQNLLTIEIYLGTPGQYFRVILDTGSSILWVAQKGRKIHNDNLFDPSKSDTFFSTGFGFEIQYVTGSAFGEYCLENLTLSNSTYLNEFMFGLVFSGQFQADSCDGIFGIGHKYFLSSQLSIMDQLFELGIVEHKIFSVQYLKNKNKNNLSNEKNEKNGYLFLGDIHEDFQKDIENNEKHYCGISQKNDIHWLCRMTYIMKGENTASKFKENSYSVYTDVIFDTGSNSNIYPLNLIDKFVLALGNGNCGKILDNDIGMILCNDYELINNISFVLNGNALMMNKANFFEYQKGLKVYLFNGIFQKNGMFLLGTPFFKSYHVLFNYEESNIWLHSTEGLPIGDVSKYTTDKDIRNYISTDIIILLCFAIILLLILIIMLIIFCKKFYFRRQLTKDLEKVENKNEEELIPPNYINDLYK